MVKEIMNSRFYIIIAVTIIAIGASVTLISTRKSANKFPLNKGGKAVVNSTVGEPVEPLIQSAIDSGNYTKLLDLGIIDKIPTTEKEIAALNSKLKTQNSKLKKIIRDRSNYAKTGGQNVAQASRLKDDNQQETKDNASTNQFPQNFNNVEQFPLNKGGKGVVNTNSPPLKGGVPKGRGGSDIQTSPDQATGGIDPALQEALLQQSVQPDDIVLNLDKVNSDYIDSIATNNGAIWLAGLTGPQYELRSDYGDRLFEIPGVGYYLLKENVAPNSEDFINEKLQVLEEALSLKPNSPELARALALTYAGEAGNLDKALATLTTFAENSSSSIDLSFEKAEILRAASENPNYSDRREKLTTQALDNYKQTIYNNLSKPNVIASSAIAAHEILSNRGNAEQGIRLLEDAYRDTERNIGNENERKMIRELGEHYYNQGDYNEALNWYDRKNIDYWAFEYAKGDVYSKLNDYNSAAQSYRKSVELNPGQPGPNIKLISTYAKNGELYAAKQALKKFNNYLNKNSKKRRTAIKNSAQYKSALRLLNNKNN